MTQQLSVPNKFTPRDYQLDLFRAMDGTEGKPESKIKRAFLIWHRRCGKDMACLAYMFKEMMERRGIYYYFFPTYSQGKKVLWEGKDKSTGRRWMNMMPGFDNPGGKDSLVKRVNNQEMLMETVNGSLMRVIGTDNIDSVVGSNPVGCVFSEYSIQDPTAWEYMSPVLAENGGWAIFNGTPRGKNHFYRMDCVVSHSKHWYYSKLQTLYPDEPNYTGMISMDIINRERESGMDEDKIAQEYGCSYTAAAKGAYYHDLIERARSQGRVGEYPPEDSRWTETSWDIGIDDDAVIWFFQRSGSAIHVIDYYENRGKGLDHYVDVLNSRGYRYNKHHLPHDGGHRTFQTGKRTCDLLREGLKRCGLTGYVNVTPKLPTQAGIDTVRHMFSRFKFNEGTTTVGLEKLGLYHRRYDEKKQTFLQQPVHDYTSHAADAFRVFAAGDNFNDEDSDRRPIKVKTEDNLYDY